MIGRELLLVPVGCERVVPAQDVTFCCSLLQICCNSLQCNAVCWCRKSAFAYRKGESIWPALQKSRCRGSCRRRNEDTNCSKVLHIVTAAKCHILSLQQSVAHCHGRNELVAIDSDVEARKFIAAATRHTRSCSENM